MGPFSLEVPLTTYERVVDGRVVEVVTPVFGDHEDTRLGCAALDRKPGEDGWRVEGVDDVVPEVPGAEGQDAAEPTTANTTDDTNTPAEPDKTTTEEVEADGTDSTPRSNRADRGGNRPPRR